MNLRLLLIFTFLFLFSGCQNLNIKTAKQWEGHYLTVDEFKSKTNEIILEENESIWVISNDTLDYILRTGR
jgi:hypothetical protein